jgi:hypothetical protein
MTVAGFIAAIASSGLDSPPILLAASVPAASPWTNCTVRWSKTHGGAAIALILGFGNFFLEMLRFAKCLDLV